jgi:hypothetical protein
MKKQTLLKAAFLIGCGILTPYLSAQEMIGSHAGFVERMGAGAREIALGQTGVADPKTSFAAYRNPAIVAANRTRVVDLFGEELALDREGAALGVQYPIGSKIGLGGAFLYRGDSHVENVNGDDQVEEALSPYWTNSFLTVAFRLSARQSLGLSYHWETIHFDFDNVQDYSTPGAFSLGWFYQYSEKWSAGIVLRQLGLNSNLTARFHPTYGQEAGLDGGDDYFPKTLVGGITYKDSVWQKPMQLSLEVVDYQLTDKFLTVDGDLHAQSYRAGVESEVIPSGFVRLGYDDGDYAVGVGYDFSWKYSEEKSWTLRWDWAMRFERNVYNFNPLTTGFRIVF